MLSRKDVTNLLEKHAETDWEYWRDSGNVHCWWLDDGDYQLQVQHSHGGNGVGGPPPYIAMDDIRHDDRVPSSAMFVEDDTVAAKLVVMAGENPGKAYEFFRENGDLQRDG
jgi:hypothetical protein